MQQPDLTRNIYIPHQKTDRVVSIANKNLADSKNIQKLQLQLQQQQLKDKTQLQINENSIKLSNDTKNIEQIQQKNNPIMLNQSISSENGIYIYCLINSSNRLYYRTLKF